MNSSSPKSPASPGTRSDTPLCIQIAGCGHIVSFKNTKMILPAKGNRRAMLITDPKKQRAMEQYTRAIERALLSAYQTAGGETGTGQSLQSWIVSSAPLDDSLDWIPESDGYQTKFVPKGEEGVTIFLTKTK